MSTPFPPKSRLKGLSAYAPPRVRGRALSEDIAEDADTPVEAESPSLDEELPAIEDGRLANESGTPQDALAWLDDAIREVVELNLATPSIAESEPSVIASQAPSITPVQDENDGGMSAATRRLNRIESQYGRPRPPRLDTEIVPPPPQRQENGHLGQILRLSLAIVFAAIVAYGVTRFYSSWSNTPVVQDSTEPVAEATPRQAEAPPPPQIPSRLVVEDHQTFANQPVSLALTVEHAIDNESLSLDGLARGTTLSAGTSTGPSSWQLQPDKLAGLYLYAPKDFVGVMNTTVKLLDPGKRVLDSRGMQLKWVSKPAPRVQEPAVASAGNETPTGVRITAVPPAPPPLRSIDPGAAAMLMQRGRDSLVTGDISAARVAFRRLADAGMPDAALALANTYDPSYLAAHNFIGMAGDRAMAYSLYQRAKELGSAEAGQILARMGAN